MNIYLDDAESRASLIPFTSTRHQADVRIGILTIRQKWKLLLPNAVFLEEPAENCLSIPASYIPTISNFQEIIYAHAQNKTPATADEITRIEYPWHIYQKNAEEIVNDFMLITNGRSSAALPAHVQATGDSIFIEPGAVLRQCIINAENGPVYIGRNAEVMEGSCLRGPVAVGENAVVKMGGRMYGGTTVGPHCVAGGEIKNSMLMEYSNKAHDGYLGDSVIGAWCNLGAGTSNSNVKNTATEVKFTLSADFTNIPAGVKGGLIMGDYCRAAINTSFNTGTVVGICCNIFGQDRPLTYIPNFTWGNGKYQLEKAFRDIDNWKQMKGHRITENEKDVLKKLYHK